MISNSGFNLSELNSITSELYLIVQSPKVFEYPKLATAHEIAGPVHQFARLLGERVREKPLLRELCLVEIPAGDARSRDVQFTCGAGRQHSQFCV